MKGAMSWKLRSPCSMLTRNVEKGAFLRLWRGYQEKIGAGVRPLVNDIDDLLHILSASGNVKKVESVIQAVKSVGIKPKRMWYLNYIQAMVMSSQLRRIPDALEAMRSSYIRKGKMVVPASERCIETLIFNFALASLGSAHMLEELEAVLRMMKDVQLKLNVQTFNALIYSAVVSKDLEGALCLYGQMRKRGLNPNALTASYVLISCERKDGLKTAISAFEEMRSSGIEYNLSVYNTMIHIYATHGDIRSGLSLLQEMEKLDIRPNATTYRILVHQCSRRRQYSKGSALCDAILEKINMNLLQPSTELLNSCLELFTHRATYVQKAEAVFREFQKAGVVPDTLSYGLLIQSYGSIGNVALVEKTLEDLKAAGLKPCHEAYNGLITCYGHEKDFDSALSVFETMRKSKVTPDVLSHNALFRACAQSGRGKESGPIFEQMLEDGIRPNVNTLVALVDCGNDHPMVCEGLVALQRTYGKLPRVDAYNALISIYIKKNELEKAAHTFQELMANEMRPSKKTFDALTNALLTNNDIGMAVTLYENFRRVVGEKRGTSTRPASVKVSQELKDIVRTLASIGSTENFIYARQVVNDTETFSKWIEELGEGNDLPGACRLVQALRQQGIRADVRMYNALLQAHAIAKDVDGFLSTFEDMRREGVTCNGVTVAVAQLLRRTSNDDRLAQTLTKLCGS